MAKICFTAISNVFFTKDEFMDSFVEQFANSLIRAGNDVLYIQCNRLIAEPLSNKCRSKYDEKRIISEIISFNPDFVITFNNVFPCADFLQKVSCPILLYPSDQPSFWNDKETIKKNLDRYFFLIPTNKFQEKISVAFKPLMSRFIPFGHPTDMQHIALEKDIPISFVGSIGNFSKNLIQYLASINEIEDPAKKNKIKVKFFEAFDKFQTNTMDDFQLKTSLKQDVLNNEAILAITCKKRFEVLSAVTDLGLKIFGYPPQWPETFQYNYDLLRAFDYSPCISYKQNLLTFNRSKISLNLPHGNVGDGFSWRVADILASGSCLLSNPKKDLADMTNKYIKLPMYESPSEARELTAKLLKDEIWRSEIVRACNEMIKNSGRFEHRFADIENAMNIKLHASKKERKKVKGNFTSLDIKKYRTIDAQKKNHYFKFGKIKEWLKYI